MEVVCKIPNTSSEIADLMRDFQITGVRQKGKFCALHNFLKEQVVIPDGLEMVVLTGVVRVSNDHYGFLIELPDATNEFLREFDSGKYPDLETANGPA